MLESIDGSLEFLRGGIGEARDAHVAILGRQHLRRDALQPHLGALDVEFEQRLDAGASHGESDRAALRSPHAPNGAVEVGRIDRHVIDPDDDVPGLDAGALGGRIGHAPHDAHAILAGSDLDPNPGIGAARARLHVLEFIGRHERRMIVQCLDHAANGALHELVVIDRIDVVVAHALDDFGEQPRIAPR